MPADTLNDLEARLHDAETIAEALARALDALQWIHPAYAGDNPDRTTVQAHRALLRWEDYRYRNGLDL